MDSGFFGATRCGGENRIEEQSSEIIVRTSRIRMERCLLEIGLGVILSCSRVTSVPGIRPRNGREKKDGIRIDQNFRTTTNYPAPHGPEGHCCTMRGDQHLRIVLPKQAKVPRIPPQYVTHEMIVGKYPNLQSDISSTPKSPVLSITEHPPGSSSRPSEEW